MVKNRHIFSTKIPQNYFFNPNLEIGISIEFVRSKSPRNDDNNNNSNNNNK